MQEFWILYCLKKKYTRGKTGRQAGQDRAQQGKIREGRTRQDTTRVHTTHVCTNSPRSQNTGKVKQGKPS